MCCKKLGVGNSFLLTVDGGGKRAENGRKKNQEQMNREQSASCPLIPSAEGEESFNNGLTGSISFLNGIRPLYFLFSHMGERDGKKGDSGRANDRT